jgi:hypothetical protein
MCVPSYLGSATCRANGSASKVCPKRHLMRRSSCARSPAQSGFRKRATETASIPGSAPQRAGPGRIRCGLRKLAAPRLRPVRLTVPLRPSDPIGVPKTAPSRLRLQKSAAGGSVNAVSPRQFSPPAPPLPASPLQKKRNSGKGGNLPGGTQHGFFTARPFGLEPLARLSQPHSDFCCF